MTNKARMTYEECSRYTNIPQSTLYSLVCRRRIPHLRLGPRFVRFELVEIDRWLGEARVAPTHVHDAAHAPSHDDAATTSTPPVTGATR